MEPLADEDELPDAMLSSLVIIDRFGQTLAHKYPMMQDLQTLCTAAHECTFSIHTQLQRLFRNCRIPLSPYEKSEFVLKSDLSPINKLLKTLQLLDPKDDTSIAMIEDYEQGVCPAAPVCPSDMQLPQKKVVVEVVQEDADVPTNPVSPYILLKTAISYPLAPFLSVIAYMRNSSPLSPAQAKASEVQETAQPLVVVQDHDPAVEDHTKYCKVLTHGKKLLKGVVCNDKETHMLLGQLKEQLAILKKGITTNIETIELDRSSFANLQQCIVTNGMTLSDMLLLQYGKMEQWGAVIDTAMQDFFNATGRKLTDVSQEEFEMRWKEIQERSRAGQLTPVEFNKLRQYSYILQNPTARFIAQTFIDGSVSTYGMAKSVAQERGLTEEHIMELNAELSNCKDFLQQLNRAFTESLKNIETAMKE